MGINQRIKQLASEIDERTKDVTVSVPLTLVGSPDSYFLRAIKNKADKLNIPCQIAYTAALTVYPVVIDTETADLHSDTPTWSEWDIDSLTDDSDYKTSSVADACITLIADTVPLTGLTVTIVGRGHAVKGLAQWLTDHDATVTVAHSKTHDLMDACANRNVVIYATPRLTQDIPYDTRSLVIDLGNCVPHPEFFYCPYTNRIGALTTSILLQRVAQTCGYYA